VLCQLLLETLDELKESSEYKGEFKVKLNAIYQMLDKGTKKYDDLYNATEEGTTAFYNVINNNVRNILSYTIPEVNILNIMIEAYNKDEKAINGIIKKVLSK